MDYGGGDHKMADQGCIWLFGCSLQVRVYGCWLRLWPVGCICPLGLTVCDTKSAAARVVFGLWHYRSIIFDLRLHGPLPDTSRRCRTMDIWGQSVTCVPVNPPPPACTGTELYCVVTEHYVHKNLSRWNAGNFAGCPTS